MSIESPKKYKVPPEDQECKGLSQDRRPRSQDDIHFETKISYLATQRVKKVTQIEYDKERPSTITRTIEVGYQIISQLKQNKMP